MGNQFDYYSFEQWCFDTNNENYLDIWDYDKNIVSPSEIGHTKNKKVWFKCPRHLHESRLIAPSAIVCSYNKGSNYIFCMKCNSLGQHIIDNYGEDYLNKIWSDKNGFSSFEISRASGNDIWLKCINDNTHPDYKLRACTFSLTHGCPYCKGKKVCYTNSLGYNNSDSIKYWSDKNDKTPFDYTHGSKEKVWWKCPAGKHDDYSRDIGTQKKVNYRCPICSRDLTKGEAHYKWNGGVSTENEKIRHSIEYREWQRKVYKKDNYTCQCCGKYTKKLEAHHLLDFATHVDLRFNVDNGLSLCPDCHNANRKESFHNRYGCFQKTKDELEEYINIKRKELGINIPFSIDNYLDGNILKKDDINNILMESLYFNKIKKSKPGIHKKMIPRSRVKE